MIEVSADWVLPVAGPPIRDGLVRCDGAQIVEVTTGRAERHHAGAAIIPGFVNAHSHLEYSVYAGFGDGDAFGPWLRTHMQRKAALDAEGIRIGQLDLHAPSLDDVFLAKTGRRLEGAGDDDEVAEDDA